MDLLKTFIKEVETLLPSLKGYIFIDKLPTSLKGTGIIFSEKTTLPQSPTFNDQPLTAQKRNISIYVYTGTNDGPEGRATIMDIYHALRGHPTIETNIDGVVPQTPIYFGEVDNQKQVYIMQVACYYHNK